ncbi:MAG TPA: hypothetical protein ACFYEK_05965 [Candidatus Wunengus sp. YC60]|uniref:hypothetical protein n=1 Tax=Candidatus Wunengus sp. YC60 TaxID=3367697 RepID=UPI004026F780
METKPIGKNKRAMITKKTINGFGKLLSLQIPLMSVNDTDIKSALNFMEKSIEYFHDPKSVLKREKVQKYKKEWKVKRI